MYSLPMGQAIGIGAIFGAALVVYLVIGFFWWLLQVIAKWKIFTKAKVAGWKSIIPFYNEYTQLKFTWNTGIFWVLLLLSVLMGVGAGMLEMEGGSEGMRASAAIIVLLTAIPMAILTIKEYYYLAKSFGKGVGYALGLIFLNPIFLLILGFGRAKYVGNKSIKSGKSAKSKK